MRNEDTNKEVIYVGETARSVMERLKEHWDDFRSRKPDSHILKHWVLQHQSKGTPKYMMKVVQFHRSALSRQVGEAIRIQRRGGEMTLNSKTEYNRCRLTRLSLEKKEQADAGGTEDQENQGEEDMDRDWTVALLDKRDKADSDWRRGLGRAELSLS